MHNSFQILNIFRKSFKYHFFKLIFVGIEKCSQYIGRTEIDKTACSIFFHIEKNWIYVINVCMVLKVTQSCPTLCDPLDHSPPGSSVHGDSPSKNTGMGCLFLLQGIFLTQGSNPGFLHCRQILYCINGGELKFTEDMLGSPTPQKQTLFLKTQLILLSYILADYRKLNLIAQNNSDTS